MKPLDHCLLYTFVDTAYLHGRDAGDVARQLADGGSDIVQLRAKTSSPQDVRDLAERILPILTAADVGLVINDHPQIAADLGAALCHLGQEDFFNAGYRHIREVLAQVGAPHPGSVPLGVGLSTHGPAQAERAISAGADYIAIGPVYRTGTKPNAVPVTLEYVRWAAHHVSLPWFAIGGITLENLDVVLAAGARRVCVVSAILNATDLVQACQDFKERLLSASRDRLKP